jgi:hypothetical protein
MLPSSGEFEYFKYKVIKLHKCNAIKKPQNGINNTYKWSIIYYNELYIPDAATISRYFIYILNVLY